MLRFPVGQACLWRDPDSLTSSPPDLPVWAGHWSSDHRVRAQATDLDRVVLTHFHDDQARAAAEVGEWGDAWIPFVVAAHESTIDMAPARGAHVEIEIRDPSEIVGDCATVALSRQTTHPHREKNPGRFR
jgi:glyoxylase-like metal-dependent hydrolase (beta-lactamase superfamily II)